MGNTREVKLKATRDAYGEKLAELGEKYEDIVVLDADLAKSTKTLLFGKKFPHRFFDMGIAEQSMIGTAAGLALSGKIPFASTFAVFATGRVYDQLRISVSYSKTNVKVVATHSGLTVGEDGATHQALEDIALARVLPNMAVVVPCDAVETEKVIEFAVEYQGPMYIRLGRSKVPVILDSGYEFKLGKGAVLREGKDVSIVATGIMVAKSLEAAEMLKERGIDAEVINMSSIKPLDNELILKSAKKTGGVVTVEEHSIIGGLSSAVLEVLAENLPVPAERVGVRDVFGESGTPEELLAKYGLSPKDIAAAAERVIRRK
ncbi:MAG: transketolase family protein [Clostridia bacterium]|nr:transketolase family protein [Clostridia bacterium]